MDRSEPTLVPEWLKGTSSGSTSAGTSHHNLSAFQSDNSDNPFSSRHRSFQSQLSGASRSDYDSPRYSGSSDRPFVSSFRRSSSINSGVSDRTITDRDPSAHSRAYASFRRSSSSRASDALEREKDWEREWEIHDRERTLGGAIGNDWSSNHERSDTPQKWSNLGPTSRFENESTLRRSRSVISNRNADNGARKFGNELGSITTAPSARGGLVSNMQKAAFEKNFPSLGAEERQGFLQSSLANVSVPNSSPSSIWLGQGQVGRSDLVRTSSPALSISAGSTPGIPVSGGSHIGGDGWKSALADAPVSNGGVLLSNGLSTTVPQTITGSSVSSKGHGQVSTSGLNMAEALVQNPARIRTPQLSIEVQRMEELALKQSRQLIPMTPSMPKTMGLSPSEKSKAKTLRSIETTASVVKASQSGGSSHLLNSPKMSQGGKLLVRKSAREMGASIPVKFDGASPMKGGNIGSGSFGTSAGAAVDVGGNPSLVGARKQRLLPDHKAVPSSTMAVSTGLDGGLVPRSKDSSLVVEEKKSVSQAQNRSDFFNALRKKASESPTSSGTQEKSSSSTGQKADEGSGKVSLSSKEDVAESKGLCSLENVVEKSDSFVSAVEKESTEKNKSILNGFIRGEIDASVKDISETSNSLSTDRVSVKVGSEEEEAAFLRSLGWEENAGGEEALTEEEINSFYREHMRAMTATNAFRRGSHRLWNLRVEMHVGNVESMSSGVGSSDGV
eukprot:Gb_17166 [translate_table: standard]